MAIVNQSVETNLYIAVCVCVCVCASKPPTSKWCDKTCYTAE